MNRHIFDGFFCGYAALFFSVIEGAITEKNALQIPSVKNGEVILSFDEPKNAGFIGMSEPLADCMGGFFGEVQTAKGRVILINLFLIFHLALAVLYYSPNRNQKPPKIRWSER